jgi:hypothetical protein
VKAFDAVDLEARTILRDKVEDPRDKASHLGAGVYSVTMHM